MSNTRSFICRRALLAVTLAVFSLIPVVRPEIASGSRLAASSRTLQHAFTGAAHEFGVPLPVLLAVSYNLSRWDEHVGQPNTTDGYGPMALTHLLAGETSNLKGDGQIRKVEVVAEPALHTLDTAANLLHETPAALERDPVQNVRGGAALLAYDARRVLGHLPRSLAGWYTPVAMYSGSSTPAVSQMFAERVFTTIRQGAARRTEEGQIVQLAPSYVPLRLVSPQKAHPRQPARPTVECPADLACQFVPAAYQVNSASDPTDYGNYNVANRPQNLAIRYIIIHDTETSYTSTLNGFQNPLRYASSNYVIRSSDGAVTQMVPDRDVAWHAGNYYVNMHAIGIEHEGYAVKGATWYSDQMYQSSADLVRYLAQRYHIPLDRAHIIGHDEVPGYDGPSQAAQHWDPGPFWDWQHFMDLVTNAGQDTSSSSTSSSPSPSPSMTPTPAPILTPVPTAGTTNPIITPSVIEIDPLFPLNEPIITNCAADGSCQTLPAQPSNFLYLHTAPLDTAPLVSDLTIHPTGSPGTTRIDDWGDKAVTGEQFVRVARQGDWDAIDYGGRQVWLYDPAMSPTTQPATGQIVTPAPGRTSIPVFGVVYPNTNAYPKWVKPRPQLKPLPYTVPAGQEYVATDLVRPDYYYAPTLTSNAVIHGKTQYYQIFFNHRIAFVRAADVSVQSMRR